MRPTGDDKTESRLIEDGCPLSVQSRMYKIYYSLYFVIIYGVDSNFLVKKEN